MGLGNYALSGLHSGQFFRDGSLDIVSWLPDVLCCGLLEGLFICSLVLLNLALKVLAFSPFFYFLVADSVFNFPLHFYL